MKKEISVLGAGAFGTALATAFARNGQSVRMWARSESLVDEINTRHTNRKYSGDTELPTTITATSDFASLCSGASVLIYACSSSHIKSMLRNLAPIVGESPIPFVNTAKGIDPDTHHFHHEIAAEILGKDFVRSHFLCLSGPSFAAEILKNTPTCVTLAGINAAQVSKVQHLLGSPAFRVYSSTDLIGCQLGGAMKNVIAIAVGIAEGMGFGLNTQAALINRGLSEISRLGLALGAKNETFLGLSGMGDLILTCTGHLSRNRTFGVQLGEGRSLDEAHRFVGSTIEGFYAAKAVEKLAKAASVEVPICRETFEVLHNAKPVAQAFQDLLLRPLGEEWH